VAAGYGLRTATVAEPPGEPGSGLALIAMDDPALGTAFLAGLAPGWIPVAVLSQAPSAEGVRAAFRAGAQEVLFATGDRLAGELEGLLSQRFGGPVRGATGGERSYFHGLVGASPPMVELYWHLEAVAAADTPVLLHGESGTGKELAARALHAESPRAGVPWVVLDCRAVPPEFLEMELFGHERSAAEGMATDRPGRLDRAAGGTLLLKGLEALDSRMQVRLLRLLEEGRFVPVGGVHPRAFTARLLATLDRDPDTAVADGILREDLRHRLGGLDLRLPPLRERGAQELFTLLDHFLEHYNQRYQGRIAGIDPLCRSLLAGHDWPGNVRELRQLAERLALLRKEGVIGPADLPEGISGVRPWQGGAGESATERDVLLSQARDLKAEVEAFENQLIRQALAATEGNRNQAAHLLGVKRTTLVEKLKKRGLG
jgi:DNA-binding NtrC family response regulator